MTEFWDEVHSLHISNEAEVEIQVILPLLQALGYERTDVRAKFPIIFQKGRRGRKHEADFMVFCGPFQDRKTSAIAVEAKAPGESFDVGRVQAES
jgi:hypothetical protein